jgi:phage major head subunit gpT-like protein
MDINRTNMNALFTGYSQAFKDAFGLAPSVYEKFSMVISGAQPIMEYPFLEAFAGMREWLGPRQIKNVSSRKLTVTEKPYEDTVGIKRRDIVADRQAIYTPIIGQLGLNAGKLWNDLAVAALVANGNWLDGAAVYGTTRKFGANTISNYTASALTACTFSSGAVTAGTYRTARIAMMSYLGHNDKPLGVIPNVLVVGPKLEATAKMILQGQSIAGSVATGESAYVSGLPVANPDFGTAELVVCPDLVGTYDDYWFLMAAQGMLKPVVVQKGEEPVLVRRDREEDDNVFDRDEFVYGTRAYGAAAVAFPHLVYAGIVA